MSSHAHTRTRTRPQISFVFCGCRYIVCVTFLFFVGLSVRPSCRCVCVLVVCCVLCCVIVVAHACTAESAYARDACTPHVTVGLTLLGVMLRSAGVGPAVLVNVGVMGTNRSGKCPSGCFHGANPTSPRKVRLAPSDGVGARVLRVVAASKESRSRSFRHRRRGGHDRRRCLPGICVRASSWLDVLGLPVRRVGVALSLSVRLFCPSLLGGHARTRTCTRAQCCFPARTRARAHAHGSCVDQI